MFAQQKELLHISHLSLLSLHILDFLTNRPQRAKANVILSDQVNFFISPRQQSVLSPLLFICYKIYVSEKSHSERDRQ